MSYKYCIVPECRNTSSSTPEKLFFHVPTGKIRDKWCRVLRRDKVSLHKHTPLWCCEDHFSLEEDVENWIRYKIIKADGKETFQLKLVKGVLPHIFNCQVDRERSHTHEERSAFVKRRKMEALKEANLNSDMQQNRTYEIPSTSSVESQNDSWNKENTLETQTGGEELEVRCKLTSCDINAINPPMADSAVSPSSFDLPHQSSSSSTISSTFNSSVLVDSSCQVNLKPSFGSKLIQAQPKTAEKETQTKVICSCFEQPQRKEADEGTDYDYSEEDQEVISEFNLSSGSVFTLNASTLDAGCIEEDSSDEAEGALEYSKSLGFNATIFWIEGDPRAFLGVDHINMSVIKAIQRFGNLSKVDIYIALRKLRLRESNYLLAKYFNLHPSSISRNIKKALPIMGTLLKTLIFWPERELIQKNVPTAFMARYSKVESIIDCFEIQIEKPTNAEKQVATLSNYKDCNTVKYLVSLTPDGLVNFISEGFTGRVSNLAIIRKSGFLEVLKEGTCVMADHGFREIEPAITQRKCQLKRPPSVSEDSKHMEKDVQLTKSISSLRIHIERAIRRVREYKFLEPHATIHHELLDIVDHATVIVCALVNLQGPLIP